MEKRKILILAHYYWPDTASTGQILQDLAEGMTREFDVTVICVVPSYTGKIDKIYKDKKYYFENINNVKVIRVLVPEFCKDNKKSRVKNILAYFARVIKYVNKMDKYNYILTISQPPILGGLLGVIAKKKLHSKLIYCIQDFNPEQISAVKYSKNNFVIHILMLIDKYSCKKSDLVVTVGHDLEDNLCNRFRGINVPNHIIINNWIDETKVYPLRQQNDYVDAFKKKYGLIDKFVVMYSGNIGLYYDLENIIKVIKNFSSECRSYDGREVIFAFVGEGSILATLRCFVDDNNMKNVRFIPYQAKEDIVYSLNAADVHWCVNAKGIKGVSCPSKAYGIMGVGKPIIGVLEKDTEIRRLIETAGCGKCCEPEEYEEIEKNLRWFIEKAKNEELCEMGMNGRRYLDQHLTQKVAIDKYVTAIMNL